MWEKNIGEAPCKNCTERYVGCHGDCKKYIEYSQKYQNLKNDIKAKKAKEKITYIPQDKWDKLEKSKFCKKYYDKKEKEYNENIKNNAASISKKR